MHAVSSGFLVINREMMRCSIPVLFFFCLSLSAGFLHCTRRDRESHLSVVRKHLLSHSICLRLIALPHLTDIDCHGHPTFGSVVIQLRWPD